MNFTKIENGKRIVNPELNLNFDLRDSIDDILSEMGFEGGRLYFDGGLIEYGYDSDMEIFVFSSNCNHSYEFRIDKGIWSLRKAMFKEDAGKIVFKNSKEALEKILWVLRDLWSSSQESKLINMVHLAKVIVGETPITQEVYETVMGKNPSLNVLHQKAPVENVLFDDVIEFCNKLSDLHKLEKCYRKEENVWVCDFDKLGYRLPKEEEWEYACKANTSYIYSGGNDIDSVAWYAENSSRTHAVKELSPNAWGLYDMSGNVWEWCWDKKEMPWHLRNEVRRIVKGGSWKSPIEKLRWDSNQDFTEGHRDHSVGFRVFRTNNIG